ncbi:MAG TPA: GNAT family N-acetyltransferase [bacterium]|nr:GNAT family N-acetyltransferase [bacterium]
MNATERSRNAGADSAAVPSLRWRLRPADPADFEAIAELRNACRRAEGMPATETAAGVADSWAEPGCVLARDCIVAERSDGKVIGCDEVFDRGAHRVYDCWGGDVLPEHRGYGIAGAMLAWAEEQVRIRVREHLGEEAFRGEVRLQTTKPEKAPGFVIRPLERAGFRPLRSFVMMCAELPDVSPEADWPEDIRLETLCAEDPEHRRLFWQGRVDSFADHWGAVPPDETLGLDRFRHEVTGPDFDPTLMWAARVEGGGVAGICFCRGSFRGDDKTGFVGHLGTAPAFRRRGLARAFLRHALAELKRRGRTSVELGVDADHPTGAQEMYEREGFRERGRLTAWGKDLRATAPEEGAR